MFSGLISWCTIWCEWSSLMFKRMSLMNFYCRILGTSLTGSHFSFGNWMAFLNAIRSKGISGRNGTPISKIEHNFPMATSINTLSKFVRVTSIGIVLTTNSFEPNYFEYILPELPWCSTYFSRCGKLSTTRWTRYFPRSTWYSMISHWLLASRRMIIGRPWVLYCCYFGISSIRCSFNLAFVKNPSCVRSMIST